MKKNDSNEGKVKKPFYKKIWFWVVVVIVLGIAGSGLGKEDKKASNDYQRSENRSLFFKSYE